MDLLVLFYGEIKELGNLGHAAQNPYSMPQLVNYGLIIIKNKNDFEISIRTWIEQSAVEHMWPNFKTNFEEEHRVLRAVI